MLQQGMQSDFSQIVKVEAQKSFYFKDGQRMAVANPGDVVEVPLGVAIELRMAQKAHTTDKELQRQKDYLPARKRAQSAKTAPKPVMQ